MNPAEIAEAFSGHQFERTFDQLAEDVRWISVGHGVLEGRAAVIAACRDTAAQLADTRTSFSRFVCAAGQDVVAVDAVGRYENADGLTVVSSCDIYEFRDGRVNVITSYTVEVDPDSVGAPARTVEAG